MMNMPEMVRDTDTVSYSGILIRTYTCPTEGCHSEWPSETFSDT